MAEPTWLSYVGAATGVVGTISGVTGAILGYIGYRRAGQMKALDLRLELRKAEHDAAAVVQSLPARLEYAKGSRSAVAAAVGHTVSSVHTQWLKQWEADLAAAKSLQCQMPGPQASHEGLSTAELEKKLIAIHVLQSQATGLLAKYNGSIAADDKEREQLRADQRTLLQGR